MKKLIIITIFLISIFIVNLTFYFLSEDYRFFLKKIKNKDEVVYLEEKKYDDTLEQEILEEAEVAYTDKENEEIFEIEEELWVAELKKEVSLWKNYTNILDLFSIYNLNKLEMNSNLFDLTDEYPDNYFEYYSKDLVLYLFPTKTYREVYDIFTVLSAELPYKINEVNNFGENSFYINLEKTIEDKFIRLVVSHNWVVFWLKIKKTEYALVKDKLNSLSIEENSPLKEESITPSSTWTWTQIEEVQQQEIN